MGFTLVDKRTHCQTHAAVMTVYMWWTPQLLFSPHHRLHFLQPPLKEAEVTTKLLSYASDFRYLAIA